VLDGLPQQIRRRCLRTLYRICGHQVLVPTSLEVPLCYDPATTPQCHGGFGDVWKGQHNGQEVAAKALRISLSTDMKSTRKVSSPRLTVSISEPTELHAEILQGGRALEHPSPSECVAAIGCDDGRETACNGIGVDAERKHQPVFQGSDRCGSVQPCKFPVEALHLHLVMTIVWLPQLEDITRGLTYMHDQGIVHGDLKGVRIEPLTTPPTHRLTNQSLRRTS